MSDALWSICFFAIIFFILSYSCRWFGRSMHEYQNARRQFEESRQMEEQTRRNLDAPPGYDNSVFTVENNYRTSVGFGTQPPVQNPYHFGKELPPTYEDAIKLHLAGNSGTHQANETNGQRRTSV